MLPEEQAEYSRYFYELASGRFGWDEACLDRVQALHLKLRPGREDRHRRAPARHQGRRPDRRGARAAGGHIGRLPCPVHRLDDSARRPRRRRPGTAAVRRHPGRGQDVCPAHRGRPGRRAGPRRRLRDPRRPRRRHRAPRRRSSATPSACPRWRRSPGPGAHLDLAGARDVTLVATGGFRRAQDLVKALALGADAIAVVQRGAAGDRLRRHAGLPHRQLPDGHRHPEAAPARPAAGAAGGRAADPLPGGDHRADGRAGPGVRPRLAVPLHADET